MEDLSIAEVLAAVRDNERVDLKLLYRLTDLSPMELESFCEIFSGFDEERRRVIVRHLADISEENFEVDFTDIFAYCLTDSFAPVRLASLDGLWDADRSFLVRPIIAVMKNDIDFGVRALAAATLGHYILMAEWQQIPTKVTEPIIEELLAILDERSTPVNLRRAALESIAASSHPRVPQLIENAYQSDDFDLRVSGIYAMGRSADKRWLRTILEEISSDDFEMRVEAARAAGSIGHSDAIQELAELLVDDELEVRLAAVQSLGKIGGFRAQELLETLADEPEYGDLHEAALDSLEEMSWLGGEIDLSFMDWENRSDEEPYLSV